MKTLQIYECSDGKRFDDKNKAEKHEQLISDCQRLINSIANGIPLKFAEFRLHDKEFIKRKREELTYIYIKNMIYSLIILLAMGMKNIVQKLYKY